LSITLRSLPRPVRRARLRQLPARIVCAEGWTRWRRWWARGQHHSRADTHTDNLTPFFYEPIIKARNGDPGGGKQCSGKSAADKIVPVPVGTIVYRLPEVNDDPAPDLEVEHGEAKLYVDFAKTPDARAASGEEEHHKKSIDPTQLEMIADLTEVGQEFVLCKGGKGGLGNVHFKSSRNRVPTQYTDGEEGEGGHFYLELRKIADAGLVGYPNAGKSTLLSRISAAHPKVAPYPFTTLTPHIGVVELPGFRRITVADIPGLVEGAHENIGLGHDFLRHIDRCKLLVFVLDMAGSEGREPIEDLQKLRRELDLYDTKLSERPWLIVANKMDLPDAAEKLEHFRGRYKKVEIIPISAEQNEGIEELKARLGQVVIASGGGTEAPAT
jgi:GTP-binding protein